MGAFSPETMNQTSSDHSEAAAAALPVVYLVDDDRDFRLSLHQLIEDQQLSCAAYATAEEFLEDLPENAYGCLILDLRMPGMDGLELQHQLRRRGASLPIVFLTGHGELRAAVAALKQGAIEFLTKPADPEVFLTAVTRALAAAAQWRDREAELVETRQRLDSLTPREREVLAGVIAGKVSRQIAEDLSISRKTVEMHRARIMDKMAASNLAALIRMCVRLEEREGPAACC